MHQRFLCAAEESKGPALSALTAKWEASWLLQVQIYEVPYKFAHHDQILSLGVPAERAARPFTLLLQRPVIGWIIWHLIKCVIRSRPPPRCQRNSHFCAFGSQCEVKTTLTAFPKLKMEMTEVLCTPPELCVSDICSCKNTMLLEN